MNATTVTAVAVATVVTSATGGRRPGKSCKVVAVKLIEVLKVKVDVCSVVEVELVVLDLLMAK